MEPAAHDKHGLSADIAAYPFSRMTGHGGNSHAGYIGIRYLDRVFCTLDYTAPAGAEYYADGRRSACKTRNERVCRE